MIKYILIVLMGLVNAVAIPLQNNGATLILEPISDINLSDVSLNVQNGISTSGAADILTDPADLKIPTFGSEGIGQIKITIIGAITTPGHYFVPSNTSLHEAISKAKGFTRLASSRFLIRRDSKLIRINIGNSHGISPLSKDIMETIALKMGDIIWVSEVTP